MVIPIMFGNSEVTYYSSCKICFRVSFLFTQINLKPVHISCLSLTQNPQFYPSPCGLVLYILFETETSFVGDHSFIDRNNSWQPVFPFNISTYYCKEIPDSVDFIMSYSSWRCCLRVILQVEVTPNLKKASSWHDICNALLVNQLVRLPVHLKAW